MRVGGPLMGPSPGGAAVIARAWVAAALSAAFVVLMAHSPARAQFACTTTPTSVDCTNTGTAAGAFTNPAHGANQDATTTGYSLDHFPVLMNREVV